MSSIASKLKALLFENKCIERRLANPKQNLDGFSARRLGLKLAQLSPVVEACCQLEIAYKDMKAAREFAIEDISFCEELDKLSSKINNTNVQLTYYLTPQDPHDADNIVMEIKSGEGGTESALFASDLVRMYVRYAEQNGWIVKIIDETWSEMGGHKNAVITIANKDFSKCGIWSRMKFEGGVHRVQRIPLTETQGRVHTSAVGVLVYPEPENVSAVKIEDSELRIDVYRSSGKGGQGVNTTDSAVRITHLPTGIVVTCQNERSQLQNKSRAMAVLASRLEALAEKQALNSASANRASQVRTVDRSERIRTYNFPENRITDHRINFKAYNLNQLLDGDMDTLLNALDLENKNSCFK